MAKDIKKIVLAYSGGLDTSIMLKWLQEHYEAEIITFTADLGQGEELEPARKKAEMFGIKDIRIVDVREEFVRDFVFPMFRANALDPSIRVIAPWREWDLRSRTALLNYAEKNQIPIAKDKRGEAPFSVDANLLHTSSEGMVLEDPAVPAPDYVAQRTVDPEQAPDTPEIITIGFEKGDPISINGEALSPAELLTKLNELGGKHGVGRLDLVENRFVGMKSRGLYETPGGTILLVAHRGIESITLDRGEAHLKDELMPKYAELIYNGFWYSPEREMLQALIDKSQEFVAGEVSVKLYKGSANVIARTSPYSLYSMDLVTFEEGAVAYDHHDAEGFIRLNGLRLKTWAARNSKAGR